MTEPDLSHYTDQQLDEMIAAHEAAPSGTSGQPVAATPASSPANDLSGWSDADLQRAINQHESAAAAPAGQPAASTSPAPQQPPVYTWDNLKRGMRRLFSDPRGAASLPERTVQNAKEVATNPNMLRYGVPVAATFASGGAGAPWAATALVSGISAGGGEALAQKSESGQITDKGQIVKSAILGGVPETKLFKPASTYLRQFLREGVVGAAKYGAAEATGETARRSIDAGEFRTYDSIGEAARDTALPAGVGGAFGGVGGIADKLVADAATRAERLAAFKDAGIEKPMLDMIFPSEAANMARVAARNPDVARLRVESTRPLVEQFENIVSNAPANEEIYSALRPYVGQLDEARAAVQQAEEHAATLSARAKDAGLAAATPEARAAATAEATAAELNAVNQKARLLYEANASLGSFIDHDAQAQQFHEVVDRLFQTRKEVGAAKFAAAGVPNDAPIFNKADLLAAAKKSLEPRYRGTEQLKGILDVIENAGGDAEALTLPQFREMRAAFTDRFSGVDPRLQAAYEAAARQAYGAVTDVSRQAIRGLPGANPEAYDAALQYWRDTAEASSSRYARPLLAREPSESTFATLGADIASGKMAEVRAFNDFVSSVAQDAPEVAKLAQQQLTKAIRNSVLNQAQTGFGIDTAKLTQTLAKAGRNIDVSTLGFGTPQDIKQWSAALKDWNVKNISEAKLDEIFADPRVQDAMLRGQTFAAAVRPVMAKAAFEENVRRQVLQSLVGSPKAAEAQAARKAADAAGLTLAERRDILKQIEADPIAQAFAGGQSYGIPRRPGGGGRAANNEVVSTILNLGPVDGSKLITALQKQRPALADSLRRRVLADTFDFFRPANSEGHVWSLDKQKVQRFFQPVSGAADATHPATIKALVGPKAFDDYRRLVKAVQMISDVEKSGGVLSSDGAKTIFMGTGLSHQLSFINNAAGSNGLILGGLQSIRDLYSKQRYRVLSYLASDRKFSNAFWIGGGSVGRAINSLPPPERALLFVQDRQLKDELDRHQAEEKNP